jgi:3-hydroxy-3-methylglutaryl CoA synthase
MPGISAFGVYLPRRRLAREVIADANEWYNPALRSQARGARVIAGWDEDALTQALEAIRLCVPEATRESIDGLYLASTTLPFADRQNAGIVSTALSLREDLAARDLGGSLRAGTSALIDALAATQAGFERSPVVCATDRRKARPASMQEMHFGDAAVALQVGREEGIARYLGGASITVDFVDHYRASGATFDHHWEERWIREESYGQIVPRAVAAALAKVGLKAAAIDRLIVAAPNPAFAASVAKKAGIAAANVADLLRECCGDTGTAHPLLLFSHALEQATPGQHIMLVGVGQGCDVLVFQVTEQVLAARKAATVAQRLAAGQTERNYVRYLTINQLLDVAKTKNSERNNEAALSVLYRHRHTLLALVGGKCRSCGTPQFPKARLCANCRAMDSQEPYSFADREAQVLSWSADNLAYTIEPPQYYGLIGFAGGGRLLASFTDCEPGSIGPGTRVQMMFRIKDFDERHGVPRYFWKATPKLTTTSDPQ